MTDRKNIVTSLAFAALLLGWPAPLAGQEGAAAEDVGAEGADAAEVEEATPGEAEDAADDEPPPAGSAPTDEAPPLDDMEPPAEEEAAPVSEPALMISVAGGLSLPQVFNRLETNFTVGFGVGYVLPLLDYRVAVVVDGYYTRPERSQELEDPRLEAGSYDYTLIQNDISLFAGLHIHFTDLIRDLLIPYVGLGVRVHFLWSEIDGNSGDGTLGFHEETSTQVGGALRLGLGLRLGPGMLFLESEAGLAPLDHTVTGEANIGNLAFSLGYRLVI